MGKTALLCVTSFPPFRLDSDFFMTRNHKLIITMRTLDIFKSDVLFYHQLKNLSQPNKTQSCSGRKRLTTYLALFSSPQYSRADKLAKSLMRTRNTPINVNTFSTKRTMRTIFLKWFLILFWYFRKRKKPDRVSISVFPVVSCFRKRQSRDRVLIDVFLVVVLL